MDYLTQSIRLAFRRLRRSPGFTAVAVLTLALGIGANTSTFTAINTAVFRPLPVDHPEQLVFLNNGIVHSVPTQSFPNYRDFRDRNTVLSGLMAYGFAPASLSSNGNNSRVWGHLATGNYFDVLGVKALRGRTFHPEDDDKLGAHPVVVISYGCWQRRFGADPGITTRKVKLNGMDFAVIGVMPAGFSGTELFFSPEFWVPMTMQQQITGRNSLETRGNQNIFAIGRLKPGVTTRQAEAALDAIAIQLGREYPAQDSGMRVRLSPPGLAGTYLRGPVVGFAAVLAAIAALVLLIACTNLASLVLARAADRRKETAICLALGAARKQLIGQLLVENLVVSLAGGLAGFLLAVWLADLFAAWRVPGDFPLNASLAVDARVFWFATAASCVASLLFGLAPAVQSIRTDLVPALKNEPPMTHCRRWQLRDILVAMQVALSVVLLVGCLLVVRSLERALTINVGFNPRGAVTAALDLQLEGYDEQRGREFQRRLIDALSALPQVESAALTSRLPLSLALSDNRIYPEGKPVPPAADTPMAIRFQVTPGYLRTMQTRLLKGRDFDLRDRPESKLVAIVNRAFAAQLFPGEDALGKRFRSFSPTEPLMEIVGIAEDGKYQSLGESPQPAMFLPLAQQYTTDVVIVIRSPAPPGAALDSIRQALYGLDPAMSLYGVESLTDHLGLALLPARLAAIALAAFGLLAITLAATGVYGVLAYAVSRRTREIGIRVAIGASPAGILRTVMGRTAILLGCGTAAGAVVALALTRYVSPLLYHVSPQDPAAFVVAIGLMASIGMLACLVPARRAVSIDAMSALREE